MIPFMKIIDQLTLVFHISSLTLSLSLQTCCAVSADHQQFLAGSSGTGSEGAMLTLWDRRNEKRPLKEFKGHTESVHGCMFLSHQDHQL